jgi:hypothetical protein
MTINSGRNIIILLIAFTLLILATCTCIAHGQESMETFFNSKVPGIKIKVDATPKSQPNGNITFTLRLTPEEGVQVEGLHYNLTMYGFVNGTSKVKIYTTASDSFEFTDNFTVPQQVYGVIYGEVILSYDARATDPLGYTHEYSFRDIKLGFYMTPVKNVYLEALEEEVNRLRQEHESLGNIQNELSSTRTLATILGVTTVIFLGTTAFLIFRRPKTYW